MCIPVGPEELSPHKPLDGPLSVPGRATKGAVVTPSRDPAQPTPDANHESQCYRRKSTHHRQPMTRMYEMC
jgi:hypothetical protein